MPRTGEKKMFKTSSPPKSKKSTNRRRSSTDKPSGKSQSESQQSRPTSVRDLSNREIDQYRQAFKMFDQNGDNKISVKELGEVMKTLGLNPTKDELKDMIANSDRDGSNALEFDEFLTLMIKKVTHDDDRGAEMRQAFRIFDKNNDSYISRSELKLAMKKLGEKVTERDIDLIIKEADLDKDGRVNYEEFVKCMFNP